MLLVQWCFSASIFCLSAQLKLISASPDSTTWPFFVQPGPCMSFQSFKQMHFSSFLWKTSTPCFECFYFTSKCFRVDKRVEVFLHKTAPNLFANVSTQLILVNFWISEVGCCCYYCKCCCFCVYRWLPSVPPAALKRKTSRAPVQLNTHRRRYMRAGKVYTLLCLFQLPGNSISHKLLKKVAKL